MEMQEVLFSRNNQRFIIALCYKCTNAILHIIDTFESLNYQNIAICNPLLMFTFYFHTIILFRINIISLSVVPVGHVLKKVGDHYTVKQNV